jgi:hypothetical protein
VDDHVLAGGAGERSVAADVGRLAPDALQCHLELAAGLAAGGDGGELAATLLELAAPRPVEAQVTVAVELVDQGERRDDAVARPVVGRHDLDAAHLCREPDPPVARVEREAAEARAGDEPVRLVVHEADLVAGRGGDRDIRRAAVLDVVQPEAREQRGLGVALGDDEPAFGDAGEQVLEERRLEVLEDPRLAVVEL